ncbi:MAG: rhomboid family intramembrane serine protease [Crocinitomicaceae bacterium]|nr:rhomboid family intramembrane serine protease [Crocinitomicaceae bacterium]
MEAPITLIIVAVTVLVSWQAFNRSGIFEKLMLNPYSVKHRKEYYRIVSHIFVHADYVHLAFNMYTFYSFGRAMERLFTDEYYFGLVFSGKHYWGDVNGKILFVALYVLGGVVAALPSLRKHSDNYGYNAVGASGAVSAIMMAFMIMFPEGQIGFFMIIPMPAWAGALVFLALEHYLSRRGGTHIAHDAHIWGALFGILFICLLDIDFLVNFIHHVKTSIGL